MLPQYWIDFLNANHLRGKDCRFGERVDETGIGANLTFFTEEESMDEGENFYPGIVVAPEGYAPVAGCLSGSGNPYFIRVSDGRNGPLYRVYHDEVGEDGSRTEGAIGIVLENYELLLDHVEPQS
jgi:hypothetical protein